MKDEFQKRMINRQNKIENLKEEYGSIEDIPFEMKERLVKETKKDMPMLNAIHIAHIVEEIQNIKTTILIHYILIALLSLGIFLKIFIK